MKSSEKKEHLEYVMERVNKLMRKNGVCDAVSRNALYNAATDTIYLIDLISEERYSAKEKLIKKSVL
jgi:hypothetical protein